MSLTMTPALAAYFNADGSADLDALEPEHREDGSWIWSP